MNTPSSLPMILSAMDRVDALRSTAFPAQVGSDLALIDSLKRVYEGQGISVPEGVIEQAVGDMSQCGLVSFHSAKAWQHLAPQMAAAILQEQNIWSPLEDLVQDTGELLHYFFSFGGWREEDYAVDLFKVLYLFGTSLKKGSKQQQRALARNEPMDLIRWVPYDESDESNARMIIDEQVVSYKNYLGALLLWKLLRHGWSERISITAAHFLPQFGHHPDQIDWEAEAFAMALLLPEDRMKGWQYGPRGWGGLKKARHRTLEDLANYLPLEMVAFRAKQMGWKL